MRRLRRLVRRFRCICAWLPVLWRDEDWDVGYLVRIVQFKLRRMAKCIEENDHIVGAERVARDMRITAAHLDRYQDSHEYGPPLPYPDLPIFPEDGEEVAQVKKARLLWAHRHGWIKEENWNAAWRMVQRKGRGWWD